MTDAPTRFERTQMQWVRACFGVTQEDIGRLFGVTPHTVANWERGRHAPSALVRSIEEIFVRAIRGDPSACSMIGAAIRNCNFVQALYMALCASKV